MKNLLITILFVLLVAGCQHTAKPVVSVERTPNAVIRFDKNHSHFNNMEGLREITDGRASLIVVNANNSNRGVAEIRAARIVESMMSYSEIYAAYRYTPHNEDANYVEVFLLDGVESIGSILDQVNAKTLSHSLGMLFPEEAVRRFERDVSRTQFIIEKASTPTDQLSELVKRFGWDLVSIPELDSEGLSNKTTVAFELSLVVDDPNQLTVTEITEVIEQWFAVYSGISQGLRISVDQINKGVVIY